MTILIPREKHRPVFEFSIRIVTCLSCSFLTRVWAFAEARPPTRLTFLLADGQYLDKYLRVFRQQQSESTSGRFSTLPRVYDPDQR